MREALESLALPWHRRRPGSRRMKKNERRRFMETAKVEIRKLQLLNDRINQCIDALNQVRLSVHGLSHSPGVSPSAGIPLTQNPYAATGLGAGYAPGFAQQGGAIPTQFGPQQAGPSQFGIGQPFNP